MAGRGTDIVLGGNLDAELIKVEVQTHQKLKKKSVKLKVLGWNVIIK